MAKRLLGGHQQKLAQLKEEEEEDAVDPGQSQLASQLLGMWAWGSMSAPRVQSLAQAALQDGLHLPDIEKLAKIGGSGRFPGNMQRDLLGMLGGFTVLQRAESIISIRLKKKVMSEEVQLSEEVKLKFLLPHKLFSCMYHDLPDAFKSSVLGGDPGNVQKFWTAMRNHPTLTSRPELRAKDLSKMVPLGLHGDGVSYMQVRAAGGQSMDVLSWTSLLSRGPTKVSSFLIFVLVKALVKDFGMSQTWPKVWKILCWSLEALASGTWPETDWDQAEFAEDSLDHELKGQPLAEGYSAFVFVLKADLEFLANHFDLNHPSSNSPCILCKADRTMDSRPWTDCRPTAAWRASLWGKDEWAEEHPTCHPLFKMAGGGIDLVFPDLMHCKHLGTDQLVLGSVLTWMVKHYLKGAFTGSSERE